MVSKAVDLRPRWVTAVHECGHAVAGVHFGRAVPWVQLGEADAGSGRVSVGTTYFVADEPPSLPTWALGQTRMIIALAGPEAEHQLAGGPPVVFPAPGPRLGSFSLQTDVEQALDWAVTAADTCDLADGRDPRAFDRGEELEAALAYALVRTRALVRQPSIRFAVVRLAEALLGHGGSLDDNDVARELAHIHDEWRQR